MDTVRRKVKRLRRIFGAWSVAAVGLALLTWTKTSEGSNVLCVVVGWCKGYSGCMCQDCAAKFIGFAPRTGGGCMVPIAGWSDASMMAPRLFFAGFAFGIIACFGRYPLTWLVRRGEPTPGVCNGCGYALTGLPADAPCPECGKSIRV